MTRNQTWLYFIVFSILLLAAVVLVASFSATPNIGFTSSAAVLGFITAVAVGIERVLEAFWTFVGQMKGSCWPMNLVNEQVKQLVSGLDKTLEPFYKEAEEAITKIAAKKTWGQQQVDAAKTELAELKARMNEIKKLAPDGQQVNLIATSTFQAVNYLKTKYAEYDTDLQTAATIANQAITGVSDFIASFKDNPGRRLISIYVGAILGLIVAGAVGLDVFKAAAGASSSGSAPYWGVAVTGLLMGLGSNPTHEVIRAIQEIKKTRKADNDPTPDYSVPADTGGGSRHGAESMRGEESFRNLVSISGRMSTFSLRRPR